MLKKLLKISCKSSCISISPAPFVLVWFASWGFGGAGGEWVGLVWGFFACFFYWLFSPRKPSKLVFAIQEGAMFSDTTGI